MKANYHTHTYRCRHAVGTERSYIERAIAAGYEILGFSDHTPYPFSNGFESGFRVSLLDLDSYITTLTRLKEEYKKDIQIPIGFEAEYYPAEFPGLMNLLKDYPIDYLILGQHINFNEYDTGRYCSAPFYNGDPSPDESRLVRYVDQSIEALDTGCFTYMAHPDLINFTGDLKVYEREMRRLCRYAKTRDILLEINFLGLFDGRNYPNPLFWRIAGEEGCRVIYGSDAHKPEMVWNPSAHQRAERLVAAEKLQLCDTAELVDPKAAWERFCRTGK